MTEPMHRLYAELASWWPLLSPPSEYVDEAADLLARLPANNGAEPATLLELGCGGGSLAFHLKQHFRMTLTDLSPAMLAISREINPACEHLQGDMRSLRLERQFDVVLVHDAIMYAVTPEDLRATLRTAAIHCRDGGTVAVIPDCVRETFEPETDHGGSDGDDGRGLRYLEWTWDPDPTDDTYITDYAFILRTADGTISVEHERHVEGLFSRDCWHQWFSQAGLQAHCSTDQFGREIFIAKRSAAIFDPAPMM